MLRCFLATCSKGEFGPAESFIELCFRTAYASTAGLVKAGALAGSVVELAREALGLRLLLPPGKAASAPGSDWLPPVGT